MSNQCDHRDLHGQEKKGIIGIERVKIGVNIPTMLLLVNARDSD